MINEAALRVLGWETPEEAIGRQVRFASGNTPTVVGVVRDFHFRTLHLEIEPLVLFHGTGLHLVVRIQPEDIGRTLEYIEGAWSDFFPDFPFAYTFLDEDIGRQYRNEMRIGYFFGVFALVAVFLTCLGLVALVSFTVERRTREIGIRKALGASVAQDARHAVRRIRRTRARRQHRGLAGGLVDHGALAGELRLSRRGGMGHILRFGRRGPADHDDDDRFSCGQDGPGQSRGSVAQRVMRMGSTE